jgi:hypothetical protein
MKYISDLRASQHDPKQLEDLYQAARRANEEQEFTVDLEVCYQASPDNVLYAAWHYRLQMPQQEARAINWKLAIPLSIITGLIFAVLALQRFDLADHMPYIFMVWAPIGACFVIVFLTVTANLPWKCALLSIIGLVAAGIYVTLLTTLTRRDTFQALMEFHLPLLAWAAIGISLLGLESDAQNRFAFLSKSVEVFVTGGLYIIVGGMLAAITIGLFEALRIRLPVDVQRFLVAGGGGVITVLAVASVYDPRVSPLEQKSEQGLGRLIPTMMRLLLPAILLVLAVYLVFIPSNFMQPFDNREFLIVYNILLFAVMGLLLGVTPVRTQDLPEKYHGILRAGIMALAGLTIVISLYALSAVVYRTVLGGLTINRLTIMGWNVINIGLLIGLVYTQFKRGVAAWIHSLQSAFSVGAVAYTVWTIFLTVAIPWLFK